MSVLSGPFSVQMIRSFKQFDRFRLMCSNVFSSSLTFLIHKQFRNYTREKRFLIIWKLYAISILTLKVLFLWERKRSKTVLSPSTDEPVNATSTNVSDDDDDDDDVHDDNEEKEKSLIELINMDARLYAKQEKKNTEEKYRNTQTQLDKTQMLQLLVHMCSACVLAFVVVERCKVFASMASNLNMSILHL